MQNRYADLALKHFAVTIFVPSIIIALVLIFPAETFGSSWGNFIGLIGGIALFLAPFGLLATLIYGIKGLRYAKEEETDTGRTKSKVLIVISSIILIAIAIGILMFLLLIIACWGGGCSSLPV